MLKRLSLKPKGSSTEHFLMEDAYQAAVNYLKKNPETPELTMGVKLGQILTMMGVSPEASFSQYFPKSYRFETWNPEEESMGGVFPQLNKNKQRALIQGTLNRLVKEGLLESFSSDLDKRGYNSMVKLRSNGAFKAPREAASDKIQVSLSDLKFDYEGEDGYEGYSALIQVQLPEGPAVSEKIYEYGYFNERGVFIWEPRSNGNASEHQDGDTELWDSLLDISDEDEELLSREDMDDIIVTAYDLIREQQPKKRKSSYKSRKRLKLF